LLGTATEYIIATAADIVFVTTTAIVDVFTYVHNGSGSTSGTITPLIVIVIVDNLIITFDAVIASATTTFALVLNLGVTF